MLVHFNRRPFSALAGLIVGAGGLAAFATGAAAACAPDKTLGVSRTISLDTAGGKFYGGLQYGKEPSLLKDGEVILTFDDGPLRRNTRKVLAALKSHCTKGSFFMVGRMAVADPTMVREVAAGGHSIAHHTWAHKNLQQRGARQAGGEIELGISAVNIAAGTPTAPFFRFPYLADPNSMLAYAKSRNLGVFSIDIDAYDYKTKSSERVYSNIMNQLRKRRKGIILFHDIQSSTANAMQRLLDTMHREGFKVVHVTAKAPVSTLADFDAEARVLHDKNRTVATASAIDGGAYENVRGARRTQTSEASTPNVATNSTTRASAPAAQATNLFSSGAASSSSAPSAKPTKDWRQAIWGN